MVAHHTADCRQILDISHNGFPFALTVINMSAFVLALLKAHPASLGNALFDGLSTAEEVQQAHDGLFAAVFLQFSNFYNVQITDYLRRGGISALCVMEFNGIRKRFADMLTPRVVSGAFARDVVPPVRRSLVDRAPSASTDSTLGHTSRHVGGQGSTTRAQDDLITF